MHDHSGQKQPILVKTFSSKYFMEYCTSELNLHISFSNSMLCYKIIFKSEVYPLQKTFLQGALGLKGLP